MQKRLKSYNSTAGGGFSTWRLVALALLVALAMMACGAKKKMPKSPKSSHGTLTVYVTEKPRSKDRLRTPSLPMVASRVRPARPKAYQHQHGRLSVGQVTARVKQVLPGAQIAEPAVLVPHRGGLAFRLEMFDRSGCRLVILADPRTGKVLSKKRAAVIR